MEERRKDSVEMMQKLDKLRLEFPEGFVFCLAPVEKEGTWLRVYRWNPRGLHIVNVLHDHILAGQQQSGTQN